MPNAIDPFRFLIVSVAGWMNQQQRDLIEYLREENKVLREQIGGRDSDSPMTSAADLQRRRRGSDESF